MYACSVLPALETYFINNENLKAAKERMIMGEVLCFNDILDGSGEVYGHETFRVNLWTF